MHSRRRIWVPHTPGLRVGPSTFPRSFPMHHFDNSPLPLNGASRLLPEVTCEIKSNPECAYSNGGNGGWALQCVLAIKSIKRNSSFRHQCKTPSLGKE